MRVVLLTHPDGTQAVAIDYHGWQAKKLLVSQEDDGAWQEAKVQFPLLSGEPRILAVQPVAKDLRPSKPTRRKKTPSKTEIVETLQEDDGVI